MRRSGILLHPTCLPGSPGVGDLGPAAHRWIEWLSTTGCGLWQILPLGPTGFADSPYQCFSAFAGNPYLISPQALVAGGLLAPSDLDGAPPASGRVDFAAVIPWKLGLLDRAWDRFRAGAGDLDAMAAFREREAAWLEDYTLFMAVKERHGGGAYTGWPEPIRTRRPEAVAAARHELAAEIDRHAFRQFLFSRQWQAVLDAAHDAGIAVIGDAPIFVAADSADAWANPGLFRIDGSGHPTAVAGVPPDYFSETGQLWGNPLYDWEEHARRGFDWWVARIGKLLEMHDIVRIDHFRAFADYWEIPAGAATAETGRWVLGPGMELFDALEQELGPDLPIIAEDLGELHDVVPALLEASGLPGMRLAQFSLWPEDDHPRDWPEHSVGYTGTHDNQTTVGWYDYLPRQAQHQVRLSMSSDGSDIAWDLIRLVWESPAEMVLAPLQDFLRLGDEARMNLPGTVGPHNWTWRIPEGALTGRLASAITHLNAATGRSHR